VSAGVVCLFAALADEESVFTRWFTGFGFVASSLVAAHMFAAVDSTPMLARGATRDQVIAEFGVPTGLSKAGNIEILHYGSRQVRLENGRVERITSRIGPRPSAPPPSPALAAVVVAEPTPGAPKASGNPFTDVWLTSFEEATRDATRRNTLILALFTNSDASPTTRQFQKEIAHHPEFVNAFRAQYVLLHADYPVRTELSPDLRAQNEALRNRLGVGGLPALLLLSAAGERLAAVEISDALPGTALRSRLIAAVAAAYELPAPATPEPPPPAPVKEATPAPVAVPVVVAPPEITSGLSMARWLILAAIAVGTLLAGVMLFILWIVIRRINKPEALKRPLNMASRISQAASGLPSFAELRMWPKENLCHVMIRLAETEGYVAEEQPVGSDKDLVLKRPGNPMPEILVCCVTGNAGVIPTRRIREMVGMLAAEDVSMGWFIAPMGFSADAQAYAEQNNVRLIDASVLLNRLSDLPSFALPKVLATAR
jgi:hypothetical protein